MHAGRKDACWKVSCPYSVASDTTDKIIIMMEACNSFHGIM